MIAMRHFVMGAVLLAAIAPVRSAPPLTRATLTTLHLPATAPTQGFRTTAALGGLSFDQPVAIVADPTNPKRLFVVEKPGRIMVVPDQTNPTAAVFLDLRSSVGDASGELGLLALALHPDFAHDGHFYVWYTTNTTSSAGTGRHDRLERFSVSTDDANVADPDSGVPLITQFDEQPNHNGGDLHFGPDGYLYLSIGDEGGANDSQQNSQRIDRDFFSCILRLDVDQRPGSLPPNPHPAVNPGTYAIPPDNPYVGATSFNGDAVDPKAVRTEMWAVGLRNPWRFSFDPSTASLWVGDVGQDAREEIDVVTRGGNYGWSYREGSIAGPRSSPPAAASFIDPVYDYGNSGGYSITGGIVYRDIQLSQLEGAYVFADYGSGLIRSLRRQADGPPEVTTLTTDAGITGFLSNPLDGNILLADTAEGLIKQLVYDAKLTGTPFPTKLSETGAFSSLNPLTPQPGFVAYEPIVAFWSDYALKSRWFALQDDTGTFGFAAYGNWEKPTGAVWLKQFDLELTRGDPATARHVETRFLVKTPTGVYGLSYQWNDEQTDATLVAESGATQGFTIDDHGTEHQQTWRFPSRSECFACHTPEAGFALSFSTRQLNQDHAYPGGTANQLSALAQAGYLDTTPPAPSTLPALVQPADASHSLDARVRSYLDVNCAQCHRPDGATPGTWDARLQTPLSFTDMINGRLSDNGGDPANRLIVPGDVDHSRIYQRISATGGATRMPPIATRERDLADEQLVQDWIADLGTPRPPSRLVNLSGRALVGTGDNVLIPGFVVEGPSARRVLIRAVGPGLAQFDVPGFIAHPTMTLFSGQTELGSNTGWTQAANVGEIRDTAATVGAFALAEDGADSAMLRTLDPGPYTVRIADADGASGVALFEVYDADSSANVRLVNMSVRAQVGADADVIIPGLIVSEGAFKTVLVRAIGPGLASYNVTNYLPDPKLTLYAADEPLESNTGWSTASNAAEIASTTIQAGAFPLSQSSADSVILTTLSAGAYTLHVSSAGSASGIALVEVYEVNSP